MAIIRKLPTAFIGDGVNAQKLSRIDKIESSGSLMLLDINHPHKQVKPGPIGHNDLIPNLLRDTLADLSGSTNGLDSYVQRIISSPARIATERTAKGGLHSIVQRTAGTVVNDVFQIKFPQAVLNYMNSNKGHSYYISLWQRTTRESSYAGTGLDPTYQLLSSGGTSLVTSGFSTKGILLMSGTGLGWNTSNPNSLNSHHFAIGVNQINASGVNDSNSSVWCTGAFGAWNNSTAAGSQDKLPSQVFYRAYVEDLTISGRTYTDVFGIDSELHNKEVINMGGRFYDDTFTDPSIVFPV